jgi:hypothetical protein
VIKRCAFAAHHVGLKALTASSECAAAAQAKISPG